MQVTLLIENCPLFQYESGLQQRICKTFQKPKILLLPPHDNQLSHILKLLNPENIEVTRIEYASALIFQLHRKDTRACKDSSEGPCFYVKVIYNYILLKIPCCSSVDCSFNELREYIQSFDMIYGKIIKICFFKDTLKLKIIQK